MSGEKYKAPRMIQARSVEFNIEYGCYIKPLEHHITHKGSKTFNFGKGDYDMLARRIMRLAKKYKYYTELDHTAFDAHVTKEHLKLTHTFYQSCYYHDAYLRMLSSKTINNKCRSRNGDKYTVSGTRMSGDVDTSIGNSLINYAILLDALSRMGIKGDVIVNGDDSIIFTDKPIDRKIFVALLREYNMESKVSNTTTDIHKVEFCRLKVVINNLGRYTMMIDPTRVIDTFGMTSSLIKSYHQYLAEVSYCNYSINKGNPVGALWKTIYHKIAAKVPKYVNSSSSRFLFLKFTNVKRDVIRLLERNLSVFESSCEFTPSMFQAWGDKVFDFTNKLTKLEDRLKKILSEPDLRTVDIPNRFLTMDHVYIDHSTMKMTWL